MLCSDRLFVAQSFFFFSGKAQCVQLFVISGTAAILVAEKKFAQWFVFEKASRLRFRPTNQIVMALIARVAHRSFDAAFRRTVGFINRQMNRRLAAQMCIVAVDVLANGCTRAFAAFLVEYRYARLSFRVTAISQ